MADEVTMIATSNDTLGEFGFLGIGSAATEILDDSFSRIYLDAQEGGHIGYGQNPEVIQILADLYAD